MAPKSVTFQRHDHLVSVLFGDLLSHSYNVKFSMLLYLVIIRDFPKTGKERTHYVNWGRGSTFLHMGEDLPQANDTPSLFVVLLLKSLLSSSVTVYCSCECAYLLRRLFIISYTSTNSLLLCDQNSWFVTIQPASPILSEPAFKETISTVKEGE